MPHSSAAILAAAAVALAGCGLFSEERERPCPRVTILKDAQRMVQFLPGGGTDLSALDHEVRLVNLRTACDYDSDAVEVDMELTIAARRGPANTTRKAPARYFVAIMGPDNRILAKRVFEAMLEFPVNVDHGGLTDTLAQTIPLENPANGPAYTIITGLQLSKEQLEFNRRSAGARLPGRLGDVPIPPPTTETPPGGGFPTRGEDQEREGRSVGPTY